MLPLSDNDLDNLGRKAAGNYDPPGAAPNWDGMAQLLDKHLPVNKRPRRRIVAWLLLTLLIAGGGFIFYTFNSNVNSKPAKEAIVTTNTVAPNKRDTNGQGSKVASPTNNTIAIDKNIKVSVGNVTNKIAADDNATTISNVNSQQSNPASFSKNKKSPGYHKAGYGKVNITPAVVSNWQDDKRNDSIDLSALNLLHADSSEADSHISSIPPMLNTNITTDTILVINKDVAKTKEDKKNVDTPKLLTVTTEKIKQQNKRKNRLELTAIYAPELTTIGFTNIDKPGSIYGLLAGYRFTDRLSLQSGFIKSKKNYTADGKDFDHLTNPSAPYKLTTVSGYCNMYEIPLLLRYQFTGNRKYNIYGSAGMSSYIMKNEFYTYNYDNRNSWSASYNTQKNYWLSVANLSIGVERNLFKNVHLGLSPFIKIPLTDMGKGKLRMQSTGINISLTYRLPFLKK